MRPRSSASSSLELALGLLAVVLVASVVAVMALVHAGPLGGVPLAYAFPAGGALYVATGLLAWWRRPANRTGALLTAGGVAWLAASLANTGVPLLIAIGTVTAVLPVSFVLHLLLVSPSGRARGALPRALVVAAYVVGLVLQAPLWAFVAQPPPYDLVLVADRPELAQAGQLVQKVVGAVVVAITVTVLVRRLREHDAAQRRVLAPLFGYGVLAVVAVPLVANVLQPLLGLGEVATAALQLTALMTVPLGFLGMVLRGGFARTGELSALITSAASSSGSRQQLQEAVAATLGDPSATLLHWSADRAAYVDTDGQEVALPGSEGSRAAVQVEVGDQRLGAVVYDARLDADADAVAAVGRVAAIAMDRERLTREVVESRQALQDASSRLLSESDRERRRIARDLHDGLQGQLVRLSMQAHRLAHDADSPEDGALAARLADEVDDAARTLRAVVTGVVPAPLVERGLPAAVQELVHDLPVRAALEVDGVPERLPAAVESTAYFVVAEALTNVMKHAGASTVQVCLRLTGDVLCIDIVDDGRGGARTDGVGSGLRGLRDRIDVLGGSLTVVSDPGGTRLQAALPCA